MMYFLIEYDFSENIFSILKFSRHFITNTYNYIINPLTISVNKFIRVCSRVLAVRIVTDACQYIHKNIKIY